MVRSSTFRTRTLRFALGAGVVITLGIAAVGCRPEPVPSASATPTPSASGSASASATPSPTDSADAAGEIALPTACEQLYSPAMLAQLQERGPLNDPGVTMTSTQIVEGLELLGSGIPTIRCTWGTPSESGLATNVSIIDAEQAAALSAAFANAGLACEPAGEATICRGAQSMITQDDQIAELTETHILRGNGWVSTYTINFDVEGYSQDVLATLWG